MKRKKYWKIRRRRLYSRPYGYRAPLWPWVIHAILWPILLIVSRCEPAPKIHRPSIQSYVYPERNVNPDCPPAKPPSDPNATDFTHL